MYIRRMKTRDAKTKREEEPAWTWSRTCMRESTGVTRTGILLPPGLARCWSVLSLLSCWDDGHGRERKRFPVKKTAAERRVSDGDLHLPFGMTKDMVLNLSSTGAPRPEGKPLAEPDRSLVKGSRATAMAQTAPDSLHARRLADRAPCSW